jgi:hypothetical protein
MPVFVVPNFMRRAGVPQFAKSGSLLDGEGSGFCESGVLPGETA